MNTILSDKGHFIVLILVLLIGLFLAIYLYSSLDKYSLLYYNDAVSHLVRARQFVDSMYPGLLPQIGTGWLPLPHLLLLPFSLIDPLFKTGFAGLVISLPSFAITAVLLYRIIKTQVGISYIAIIGAFLYASNPNIIYLGITAMTEAPFMLFFVMSAYYFQRWWSGWSHHSSAEYLDLKNPNNNISQKKGGAWSEPTYLTQQLRNLIKCSIFISLATLCRYEGWIIPIFLVVFVIIVVAAPITRNRHHHYSVKYKASMILISVLSFSGIAIWLIYNAYYYGDPLKFLNAPYWSAASQAIIGVNRSNLYLQPLNVASIYTITALAMYGPTLLLIASVAIVGYIFHTHFGIKIAAEEKRNDSSSSSSILYIFLALPAVITIFSMIIGIGEMNKQWFNSRFLILIGPLIILLASVLIIKLRERIGKNHFILATIIGGLFIYQFATLAFGIVVTFLDARQQMIFSAARPFAIKAAEALSARYNGGLILIITGSAQQNNIMQQSGIPLRNFDTILEGDTWKDSFKEPWLHAKYIIISKKADPSAANVAKYWLDRQEEELNKYFDIVYEDKYYGIMVHK